MTHPVDPEKRAARFISLDVHESTHDRLVWGMRQNRDKAVAGVPQWEQLRELASQIKEHTLTHLDQYLEQFEQSATKLGTHVHWARDAEEHNTIVYEAGHRSPRGRAAVCGSGTARDRVRRSASGHPAPPEAAIAGVQTSCGAG